MGAFGGMAGAASQGLGMVGHVGAGPGVPIPTNPGSHGVSPWHHLFSGHQLQCCLSQAFSGPPDAEMHTVLSTLSTASCHSDPKRDTETPTDPW